MHLLAISFDTIRTWVTEQGFEGGVLVVFLLLFGCGLGVPLPEDIPLIVSGAFLCTTPERWLIVGFACWAGIIGGDVCLYFIARRYGMGVTKLPLIGKHVTRERIAYVEGLFEKYGVGVVAIARLFAGIRGAMVVAAGAIRYNFLTFVIVDSLAAIVSGGLWMLLGWWLGSKINDKVIGEFKHWFVIGALVLVVGFVGWIIWKKRHRGQVEHKTDEVVERLAKRVDRITHHGEPKQG